MKKDGTYILIDIYDTVILSFAPDQIPSNTGGKRTAERSKISGSLSAVETVSS
jgi:hypothetical protein